MIKHRIGLSTITIPYSVMALKTVAKRHSSNKDKIDKASTFMPINSGTAKNLGMDSLDVVNFIMDVEGTFGIRLPDSETSTVRSVGQLHSLILKETKKDK